MLFSMFNLSLFIMVQQNGIVSARTAHKSLKIIVNHSTYFCSCFYYFRWNSDSAHIMPDVTMCYHHIEWYHIVCSIASSCTSRSINLCRLSMTYGAKTTISSQNFPKLSRRWRRPKQQWSKVDLMAICKKCHVKNVSSPILMPYFTKQLLNGWWPLMR